MGNVVVALIILCLVIFSIVSLFRNRKNGQCNGSCSECAKKCSSMKPEGHMLTIRIGKCDGREEEERIKAGICNAFPVLDVTVSGERKEIVMLVSTTIPEEEVRRILKQMGVSMISYHAT